MNLTYLLCLSALAAACAQNPPMDPSSTRTTGGDPTITTVTTTTATSTTPGAPNSNGTANGAPTGEHKATSTYTAAPNATANANNPKMETHTNDMTPPPAAVTGPAVDDRSRSDADNTRLNQRDRNGASLTPMDQGGSEGDRKITQRIRQAVVGDGSLSFMAKNVKIITIGGKVTLRGPVKSDAERATIEARAKQVAGDAQVDNQLEVKK